MSAENVGLIDILDTQLRASCHDLLPALSKGPSTRSRVGVVFRSTPTGTIQKWRPKTRGPYEIKKSTNNQNQTLDGFARFCFSNTSSIYYFFISSETNVQPIFFPESSVFVTRVHRNVATHATVARTTARHPLRILRTQPHFPCTP